MDRTAAILDPDKASAARTRVALEGLGLRVKACSGGGGRFVDLVARERPGLVVMELELPGMSGWQVLRGIRDLKLVPACALVVVTNCQEPADASRSLQAGADDFMPKPLDYAVFAARIGALLRRAAWSRGEADAESPVSCGRLALDRAGHAVTLDAFPLELRPREFDLLYYLITHTDRVLPRSLLLDQVWKSDPSLNTRTIDKHVEILRRKVKGALRIETVYGVGYRVIAPR